MKWTTTPRRNSAIQKLQVAFTHKPRNPVAPAAGARRAGPHGSAAGARRQQAQQRLRHELDALQTQGP